MFGCLGFWVFRGVIRVFRSRVLGFWFQGLGFRSGMISVRSSFDMSTVNL